MVKIMCLSDIVMLIQRRHLLIKLKHVMLNSLKIGKPLLKKLHTVRYEHFAFKLTMGMQATFHSSLVFCARNSATAALGALSAKNRLKKVLSYMS